MVCDCIESGRRGMTISVIILGGALCTVMFAYLAFGDTNDMEGLRSLRMIAIIYRHGDRTPTKLYKNDPNSGYEWPGGFGSLTEKGSLQMYSLGKNLRLRYYRLLPPNGMYSQNSIQVTSSAHERCIMSAQSFLAGFMPPLENRNLLPIHWQPVPVHTINRKDDHLIAQKKACPKYDEALNRLYTNPTTDLKELNEKSRQLYELLSKYTGENVTSVLDVELIYNTLAIEKNVGLDLPDWTEGVFPDKMLPLAERSLAVLTETPFMKKIKGGALVTEIADKMEKKRRKVSPDRSIFMYSGHDVTLVNVMSALGVISQTAKKPDYSSALVLELHHSITFDDDFEVKIVYYYNSEDKFPKELSIPNCSDPCSLTNFLIAIKQIELRDYDEICKIV